MANMTYHQWEKLTFEQQNDNILKGRLPIVPLIDLKNDLIMARMIIEGSDLCWEVQKEGESQTEIFTEYKKEMVSGETIWYKFNPISGDYVEDITNKELSEPIGSYGEKWIDFMKVHHPKLVREMRKKGTFETVARSVDKSAWDYRELLDRQYAESHPRPHTFEETVSWEYTRAYYTDNTVMRERVLIPLTQP